MQSSTEALTLEQRRRGGTVADIGLDETRVADRSAMVPIEVVDDGDARPLLTREARDVRADPAGTATRQAVEHAQIRHRRRCAGGAGAEADASPDGQPCGDVTSHGTVVASHASTVFWSW
jgi:hypothetical protein